MTSARNTAEPLRDLIVESLEDAAFLWKRWESDLGSLTRNLDDVWSWTEDRLHGALDGVRVAGEAIVTATEAAITGPDGSAVTVAAHLLAASSPPSARAVLAAAIRDASGERLRCMTRGIEAAELDGSFAPVTAALSSSTPEHAAALCRLKAFRRAAPGRELLDALESQEPACRIEALHALGVAGDDSWLRYARAAAGSDDPAVRQAAIECGIRRKLPQAWDAALQLAQERSPECAPLLSRLASLGSPEEQRTVISALREPALRRAGLFALGYVGTPEAVEICLAGMRDAGLARSAGEAYCAVTGADLARDLLAAPEPPDGDSPPPFEADPLDANLVPQGADLWPLPDAAAVRRHWDEIKPRFAAGVRHLYGRPAALDVLLNAVECGPMLRRADLAFELAVRTGGRYDVEPRAFARVQRRMMAAGRARLAPQTAR